MTAMTRWNPFAEFEDILDRYNRQMAGRDTTPATNGNREILQKTDWAPSVDITENKDAFVITAELPGIRKEDVKVSVHDGVLTIQGERNFETTEDDAKRHRVERFYGHFARSFTLPEHVDDENIKANYHDGVLELTLAKQEKAKPRAIEVEVN
ncbi:MULTISPECIES: Hsp20/alpha crystallin family protein [Gammaproteobacteria]|uniref:Hsp20 family protein n=1 Tax=Vreelandella halophila TaxID=86177 RepID=A0A9X4Y9X3_9GAMM|nr:MULTISPECIES: Hsp20/alpha crystallin family protein [Gammaproteobacteria]KAA8982937.1 Hsp20/alpha crystallin family protein [Halospina sp. K52047b]MYL25892.1 Hsp20 family protein [Halomonas utahensis]MYL73546.1 Hsp20 family protein [Halomonas sp. 22501_18_FS]